ncbi:PPE family protein [Stackebrandtia albiflava]|uniref:PPE family protein n=1 Tax=Stackebrandtia albiflava TaxID=406432 RepID=A0A562URW1_9ACTN|nr:PPE domain-containing protein [Stackebrandtia albiflava]TWJ08356.1 PPE family protein [Stackebrandtia albiflava]
MADYSGTDFDTLIRYVFCGRPGALDTTADEWRKVMESLAEVRTTLDDRLKALRPHWRGGDADAHGQAMTDLSGFAAELSEDAADVRRGAQRAAAALRTAQEAATPLREQVEAETDPVKREKLKKRLQPQLAAIMQALADAYRDVMDTWWHDPAAAPDNLPDDGAAEDPDFDATLPVAEAPRDSRPVSPYSDGPPSWDGYTGDAGAPQYTGGTGVTAPGGGLASAGSSTATASAPAATAGLAGATAGVGGQPHTPPPVAGLAGAGASGGWGPAGAGAAARSGGDRSGRGGLFPATGGGAAHDEEEGDETWLTEDQVTWTATDAAPTVIGSTEWR